MRVSGPRSHCDGLFIPGPGLFGLSQTERCCCLRESPQFYFRGRPSPTTLGCQIIHLLLTPIVRSVYLWQIRLLARPTNVSIMRGSPRPCLLTYQRRYSNDKQLSSVVMLRDMMTSIPEWQTQQWCGSWDSVNWKWEIKSRISHWIQVSKFSFKNCYVSECVMA